MRSIRGTSFLDVPSGGIEPRDRGSRLLGEEVRLPLEPEGRGWRPGAGARCCEGETVGVNGSCEAQHTASASSVLFDCTGGHFPRRPGLSSGPPSLPNATRGSSSPVVTRSGPCPSSCNVAILSKGGVFTPYKAVTKCPRHGWPQLSLLCARAQMAPDSFVLVFFLKVQDLFL